MSLRSSPAACA
uniref:Uncharacterized protein n=1 Tax=Arundo donax TaxID=35708 RepID=A0A0A8ZCZ2_ARUDO